MAKAQFIYFLRRSDGLVKIGYSTRVKGRIRELEKSHGKLEVIKVVNGDKRREDNIHHLCRRHHEYGEWFRDSSELRTIIDSVEEGPASSVGDEEKKAWLAYEDEVSARVAEQAKALVSLEYHGNGNFTLEAIKATAARYGIPFNTLHHLFYRRTRVVSAATAEKIREALLDARQRRMEALLQDIEAASDFPDLNAELNLSDQIVSLRSRLSAIREGLAA